MACGQVRAHQVVPTRELGPDWVGAIPTRGARGPPERGSRVSRGPRAGVTSGTARDRSHSGTRIFRPPHYPWTLKSFVKNVILFRPFSRSEDGSESLSLPQAKFLTSGGGVQLEKKRLTISPSLGQGLPDTPARKPRGDPAWLTVPRLGQSGAIYPHLRDGTPPAAGIGFPSSRFRALLGP